MPHVIVMEDDEAIRKTLVQALDRLEYSVEDFADAALAFEQTDFHRADLVLTDLRMPMRGSVAIRALRDMDITCPIIVISGYLRPQDQAHLKALGASAVIAKPFRIQELYQTIQTCLEGGAGDSQS